jgi:predicted XRE-type DNA-binding protein
MAEESNKPRHVTRGDVFDDLGFSRTEAATLKVKAKILNALVERIRQRGYSQRQLVQLLDDYQPNISNLLNGKISKMSIEKLLCYAQRLNLETEITVKPRARSTRSRRSRVA